MKELEKLLESGDFEIHGENGEVFKGSDLKKEGIEVYLKKINKRLEEALRLKGDHEIYFHSLEDCPEAMIENAAEIADLSECIKPERLGGDWGIPDHTPDWLYDIIDLFGGVELMESIFEFESKEIRDEFKEICEVAIYQKG